MGVRAEDLLALEGIGPSIDASVFLSGSLVEGMGNQSSDIDVFVVGEAKPTGENIHVAGDAVFSVHMHGKRRVDFEYWRDGAALALAEKLDALTTTDEGSDNVLMEKRLTDEEIAFMHRVRTGVPLLHDERFDRLRSRFEFARLSAYLTEVKLREIDDAVEDVCGMMDDGDVDVGLMRARDLLNVVCDAYGHHLGSTNIRRKWRTKVLEAYRSRDHADEVLGRFWELQFPDGSTVRADREAYRAYAERCVRLANKVTDWILG
ncbi:MAG TPA: nucleotidyltransferase domain-containing protein [Polyangiaceae bacterium]